MSKEIFQQTSRFTLIGIGLLSVSFLVTFFSGCGQDRPGVRMADSKPPEGHYDPMDPKNLDQRLDTLMQNLVSSNPMKSGLAATALGNLGAKAEPKLEELKSLQDHPDKNMATLIKETIGKIEADIAKQKGE